MATLNIHPDKEDITNEIKNKIDNLLPKAIETVDDTAEIFRGYFAAYTPIGETSDLYNMIIIDDNATLGREITSKAKHLPYVVDPTKPHIICPVQKLSLYWPELGHPLPIGRCVQHPGTPGNDFPMLAYMDGIGDAENRVESYQDWITD